MIVGFFKVISGSIFFNGEYIENKKFCKIMEVGLGYILEDCYKYGLVFEMFLGENIVL